MPKKNDKKDIPKLKKTTKTKKRLKSWVWLVLLAISLGGLFFSGYKILAWNNDNKKTEAQIKEIEKVIKVEEIPNDEETQEIVNPPSTKPNPNNDYWNYIKLPLISVDFTELLKKNSDTVAFIKVNGTNINYPVVQTTDNNFYLNHSYNKTKNEAGWVFLDYRNNINNLDDNTIIYAHSRLDTTMFGSLRLILTNNWYKDTDNYVINISTPEYNTLWQVFSVYAIPTETYYLTSNFATQASHQEFINTILSRSAFNFNTTVDINDKILTLSTCKNNDRKVVLHAKLIKQQAR